MKNFVIILTCLSCWTCFMLTGMALLVANNEGLVYYGIGLVVSGVALKLELDAWLR